MGREASDVGGGRGGEGVANARWFGSQRDCFLLVFGYICLFELLYMCLLRDRQLVCTRGGKDACDEAAEISALNAATQNAVRRAVSRRHSPLSDELNRKE